MDDLEERLVKILPRLVSPVLLGLILLTFLLPFVAVSCEVPGVGSFEGNWTGVDLATGGDPSIETAGELGNQAADPVAPGESPPDPSVQVFAIITAVLVAAGLVVSLFPLARPRLLAVAGAAGLAGVLLVVTQAVAQSNLSDALLAEANKEQSQNPTDVPFTMTEGLIDEMVQTRIGFWLALIGLILVLGFNIAIVVRDRLQAKQSAAAEQPPPAAPPEPPAQVPPPQPAQ